MPRRGLFSPPPIGLRPERISVGQVFPYGCTGGAIAEGLRKNGYSAVKEFRLPGENPRLLSRSRSLPTLGFLVVDAMLKLLSANPEAIAILTYPEKDGRPQSLAEAFERKIRRHLVRGQGSLTALPTAFQFNSGRRTYFCRTFDLDGNGKAPNGAAVVMVLERGISESLALSQVAAQFHLTRREQEAVALLLQGLGNKEMADRMAISANTVKALLRLVMVKMGVSNRSAVVATVLGLTMSAAGQKIELAHLESGVHPRPAPL